MALSIYEALDNLNALLDVESLDLLELTEEKLIAHVAAEKGYWLKAGLDETTIRLVKESFKTVYHYLQGYYHKQHKNTKHVLQGINTLMVLVGESAKKLESFNIIFKEKVTHSQEYEQIQNFYRSKVVKKFYQDFKENPASVLQPTTKQQLLDALEIVKADTHYELFYIRNEEGALFYTPSLSQSIKVECDFGQWEQWNYTEDPLLQIPNWEDKSIQHLATQIYQHVNPLLKRFYHEKGYHRKHPLVQQCEKCVMALMLARYSHHLIRQFSRKSCSEYFSDFLFFLREAISHVDFKKAAAYLSQDFFSHLVEMMQEICYLLYTQKKDISEIFPVLQQLSVTPKNQTWLVSSYAHAVSLLQAHPQGPLFKALDLIRDDQIDRCYDPLLLGNIGYPMCALQSQKQLTHLLHVPCPVKQHVLQHAYVSDEFLLFLNGLKAKKEKLLYINLHTKKNWEDTARCQAMEKIADQEELMHSMDLITYPDSSFFLPYTSVSELLHALETEGLFFSYHLKTVFTQEFFYTLQQLLAPLFPQHLELKDQLLCVDVIYAYMTAYLLNHKAYTYLSFSSKDGLDLSAVALSHLLFLVAPQLKIDEKFLWLIWGPTLLQRQRLILPHLWDRIIAGYALYSTEQAQQLRHNLQLQLLYG